MFLLVIKLLRVAEFSNLFSKSIRVLSAMFKDLKSRMKFLEKKIFFFKLFWQHMKFIKWKAMHLHDLHEVMVAFTTKLLGFLPVSLYTLITWQVCWSPFIGTSNTTILVYPLLQDIFKVWTAGNWDINWRDLAFVFLLCLPYKGRLTVLFGIVCLYLI